MDSPKDLVIAVGHGPEYAPTEYQLNKIKEVEKAIAITPTGNTRDLLAEYNILLRTQNIFTNTLSLSCEHQTHQVD